MDIVRLPAAWREGERRNAERCHVRWITFWGAVPSLQLRRTGVRACLPPPTPRLEAWGARILADFAIIDTFKARLQIAMPLLGRGRLISLCLPRRPRPRPACDHVTLNWKSRL